MKNRGFTLVECLIGLAISAILLAAIAAAINASAVNYGENEDMFRAINSARQALTRMTAQIRTGHDFDIASPANKCSFFTSADVYTTYEYADQKLYVIQNGGKYVLCDNVTAATFTKTLNDAGDQYKSVQISLTVQSRNVRRTLSGAAVVRRNLGT
ncbi:MAG TPA: prepilin-type N-terminal cleavage/methylation domain-containing protein [Sedimentisphaerales bacterium]|jgi:prepilin-type N-terminal cleavage/methylation domain-containing protein|nr:prepilin-type N-terminal cleavage/methylation domain-containing protein [Sedimentisphaerales bacterium]HNU28665.1 prepilin-type N-terminal cleavage/methylation domain-containing protein [Sedimentisphaerales bacterium]